jgi:hypothetical protein
LGIGGDPTKVFPLRPLRPSRETNQLSKFAQILRAQPSLRSLQDTSASN